MALQFFSSVTLNRMSSEQMFVSFFFWSFDQNFLNLWKKEVYYGGRWCDFINSINILLTGMYLDLTCLAYFLSTFSLRLLVAVAFPWGACTSVDVAVWASSEIIMMTRQKVVAWQQRLCPETTHAVLTAGEQNVAHCASVHGDRGREEKSWQRIQG